MQPRLARGRILRRLSVERGKLCALRRFAAGEQEIAELTKKRFAKLVADKIRKQPRTTQQKAAKARKTARRKRAGGNGRVGDEEEGVGGEEAGGDMSE